ncbi:glycosyltransferase [Aliarcobacter butzleri]
MKKKIVVFGIDNFSKKNIGQLDCLLKNYYELDIFTNDVFKNSILNTQNKAKVYILEKSFLSRFKQVYNYLKLNSKQINHAEIYPGGRFAFVYIFLCRVFKIKTIAVERGDLLYYSRYDKLTQFSMRMVYKNSNIVWYRELYMKNILESKFTKNIIFLHNSVNIKKLQVKEYKYNFLWVNRFIKERKVKWFVDSVNELKFSKSIMLGLMNLYDEEKYALSNQSEYLEVFDYQDPKDYYLNSKFFVLPSDVVFLNNALLEAMSYGVVPLISDVQDARLIVDDGINGFIFEHTENGLKNAMKKAMLLSQEEYEIMSKNAIKKVEKSFSYDVWCEKYINMIKSLNNV